MGFVEIVLMVCTLAQPGRCEEQHLPFNWQGSLNQCVMGAPPYIAQWAADHPKWQIERWRCEYPGQRSAT